MLRVALAIGLATFAVLAAGQGTIVPPHERPIPVPWGPWAIKSHRVEFTIKEGVAETRVEQVFVNLGRGQLEADYVFPVPVGASISRLTVRDGDKLMEAKILPAEEARRIYESIVRQVRDPALLEYMGSRLVRLRLFPIQPGDERAVSLTYSETLPRERGAYRYVYPMRLDGRSEKLPERVLVTGEIETAQPIHTIHSPTHPDISVRPDGPKRARVSWESGRDYRPRDFQLLIQSGSEEIGLSVLPYRSGGDGYFLLFLSPRMGEPEREIPKNVVFTFDRTGSMSGEKIRQAKAALRYCIEHLRPMDRFEVVLFDDAPDPLFHGLVEASGENIRKALRFVDGVEACGGTNILDALKVSLDTLGEAPRDGFNAVVFLTDGRPTVGETDTERIRREFSRRNDGRFRLFSFGVGRDVDSRFLDRVSFDSKGDSNYVLEQEEIQATVEGFFEKVSVPALRDVEVRYEGADAYDVFPREPRDLFRGTAMVVAGRYRGSGGGRIVVTGKSARGEERAQIDVRWPDRADRDDFVSRVWAARKIAFLLDQIRLDGTQDPEIRDEIVRLSLDFGIITPLTSFLITEDRGVPPQWRVLQEGESFGLGGQSMYRLDDARVMREAPGAIGNAAAGLAGRGGADAETGAMGEALRKTGGGAPSDSVSGFGRSSATVRIVGDKTFYKANGIWTDSRLDPKAEIIEIEAFSDAHMRLIERMEKFGVYSTVGLPFVVRLPGGAVKVGDEGKEQLTDTEIAKLLKEERSPVALRVGALNWFVPLTKGDRRGAFDASAAPVMMGGSSARNVAMSFRAEREIRQTAPGTRRDSSPSPTLRFGMTAEDWKRNMPPSRHRGKGGP